MNSVEICMNSVVVCMNSVEICMNSVVICMNSVVICMNSVEICRIKAGIQRFMRFRRRITAENKSAGDERVLYESFAVQSADISAPPATDS